MAAVKCQKMYEIINSKSFLCILMFNIRKLSVFFPRSADFSSFFSIPHIYWAQYETSPLTYLRIHPNSLYWGNENWDQFVCRVCKKSFYSATALQNHKNSQHDAGSSESEAEEAKNKTDQVFDGLCGFKFYPLEASNEDPISIKDNITRRTYGVDTSYLIVKIEGDDISAAKKSRLDGIIKRTQTKNNKPVDLRGPFTCTLPSTVQLNTQCRQTFVNCCEYSLHYREQHTKRRKAALRCQVCEKRLDREFYLTNNYTPPKMDITFSCRICSQIFLDSYQLDEHNRLLHTKTKPHQCPICAKRFTQQGGLQQHMRMHSGIRPFVCVFCTKAFTQKAGLDQHLRTHTKVKPFKCIICSKCFSQSVHLRQHMRTHTNIQPFECPMCGRRFKQSSHLNFHMKSHVGSSSAFLLEQYAQAMQQPNPIDFLNLSNVQPVRDGETMYYAAEITPEPTNITQYTFSTTM